MSVTLTLETGSGDEPPTWFTQTDSKEFLRHLCAVRSQDTGDNLYRLLDHLHLSIAPLLKIADAWGEPLESWMARDPSEWRRQAWEKDQVEREAAWQPPADIVGAIHPLLTALQDERSQYQALGMEDEYFADGLFRVDLADLLRMAAWAGEQGFARVRLVVG